MFTSQYWIISNYTDKCFIPEVNDTSTQMALQVVYQLTFFITLWLSFVPLSLVSGCINIYCVDDIIFVNDFINVNIQKITQTSGLKFSV